MQYPSRPTYESYDNRGQVNHATSKTMTPKRPKSPVLNAIETLLREEKLPWTDFSGWNLSDLELANANLRGAKLQGANLWGSKFQEADLTDAEIEKKWRDVINWKYFQLNGMPKFVENTSELPPKMGWLEKEDAAEKPEEDASE